MNRDDPFQTFREFQKKTSAPVWKALKATGMLERREILYQAAFYRSCELSGITTPFYAFKSAANFSLLYLMFRIIDEYPQIETVLELGSGQTTLLLNELSQRHTIDVTSVEHDSDWCTRVSQKTKHNIVHAPLIQFDVNDQNCIWYDLPDATNLPKPNLLCIDGPGGVRKKSRWGALSLFQELPEDFIVIFDDANRPGEKETIKAALDILSGRDLWASFTISTKAQFLIGSKSLAGAAYF